MPATEPLTVDDLAAMEGDPRWDGHGYIRARAVAAGSTDPDSDFYDPEAPVAPEVVEAADYRIIEIANERGWDYGRLFEWANSKNGRYFADAAFGGGDQEYIDQAINDWRLI